MIFDDMSEDMWASEEDEDLDPELKAAQDREVEEFRKRLESIQTSGPRPKITITGNSNPELKGSSFLCFFNRFLCFCRFFCVVGF